MCLPKCTTPKGNESHCPSCHHTFKDVGAFDDHRRRGACVLPARKAPSHRGTFAGPAPQGGTTGPRIPAGRTLNGRKLST